MFRPVPSKVSFAELDKRILQLWRERDIYRRSESEREGAPLFVLYEGPPTANGSPGIHHVLARVFKDVIPRYKTMKGFHSLRKGGWDTHGLPVELEVEKELGLSSKREIEEYGVAAFNRLCRESVFRYVKEWEAMTERIGFWIDMAHPYVTLENDYIETGWWMLHQLWDKGLIYEGMKGTPHCPRCVTSLSSHEVALGYREDTPDPSVYIRFPLEEWPAPGQKPQVPTSLLAWTTTPWTLPGNTALAVAPDEEYAVVEVEGDSGPERLVLARALVEATIEGPHRIVETVPGSSLVGLAYRTPYDATAAGVEVKQFRAISQPEGGSVTSLEPVQSFTPHVIATDFVSLDEGTGIVHIAPAFGDEDLQAGREHGLAFIQSYVELDGTIRGNFPFAGKFVKDADEEIMQDLAARGVLYRRGVYHHTYPFCWRCGTPLLYYAKSSWYIRTTALKERLVSGNSEINWYPEYLKEGRFGEWLRNNVDWAISRERYWGTPIPVWRCQSCQAQHCVGSVQELRELALPQCRHLLEPGQLDLHRPYVDDVLIRCSKCGGEMRRIPEVMDCWFDSGAMPFAQYHYPFENSTMREDGRFPADYICEAVDQTRGWFYSLHALSTLLTNGPCYRNVICLGLILDEKGEKMSKSRGNVVEPWPVLDAHGADALRWYLFTAAPPGNARRFSARLVEESLRQFLLTLWNTYSFFVTYANLDGFDPSDVQRYWKGDLGGPDLAEIPSAELDRWVISGLNGLVASVTELLEHYNPTDAARRIEEFVDALSNWYVRRSRRRFWKSENDRDKESAYVTLYTCLTTLSKLLAPLTPFMAEELYQNLVRTVDPKAPESVHLARYPEADLSLVDERLDRVVRLAMRVSSLGRAARTKAKVKVRQPLARVLVKTRFPEERDLLAAVTPQVLDELNVKALETMDDEAKVVEFSVRPNHALLGPKYGARMREVQAALREAKPALVATSVRAGAPVQVGDFLLEPDEVSVTVADRPGLSTALEGGYAVAVDVRLTPELEEEGLARELVHRLQNMRRSAGLEISDRIVTFYQGGDERLRRVMERFGTYIRQETLSLELRQSPPADSAYSERQKVDGLELTLAVQKA
ncbi:MAG: isoleucine--tRNA ligase [Chloroflexi bacterium]|nr:isoleucine--tRNA ligase [Chloroflexota bacterium]